MTVLLIGIYVDLVLLGAAAVFSIRMNIKVTRAAKSAMKKLEDE